QQIVVEQFPLGAQLIGVGVLWIQSVSVAAAEGKVGTWGLVGIGEAEVEATVFHWFVAQCCAPAEEVAVDLQTFCVSAGVATTAADELITRQSVVVVAGAQSRLPLRAEAQRVDKVEGHVLGVC